jgi:acyl-CoA dehydrogenase
MLDQKDHIVAETAARIFADLADPQTINREKNGAWKESLWQTLDDAKLPLAWVPERLGGSGASLAEGFAILGVAGRFALAVPLAETLASGWLLASAGLEAPAAAMTVAPARPHERITMSADGRLNGRVSAIPFAQDCAHIAVLADNGKRQQIALVDVKDCRLTEGHNLAGDSVNTVTFDCVKPKRIAPATDGFDTTSLLLMGAVIRGVETAGALEAILSLSVAYANERVAFERPIGKFQAVQQNLARLAGEVAAALAVSGSAADAIAQAESSTKAFSLKEHPPRSAPQRLPERAQQSRIKFSARSVLPRSICCTALRCVCSPGATISATRATGPLSSASAFPPAAPMNFGR